MKFFNRPIFAIIALAGFVWLCNQHVPTSYTPKQVSGLSKLQDHYLKFRIGQYAEVHSHHMTQDERRVAMNDLFGDAK